MVGVCMVGVCMVGVHGGGSGKGGMHEGHVWQGACMAGGCAWQEKWQLQWVVCILSSTGMHSCLFFFSILL